MHSSLGQHRATPNDTDRGNTNRVRSVWRLILHVAVSGAGIFLCYQLAVSSARTGASRLFSMTAIFEGSVEPTSLAVRLTPNDPEAHYTRALSLLNDQKLSEALQELRVSIELRPHHYYEWLDLGVTLDRVGDEAGAADALYHSIELAPRFAQPHWQLGSLLYREGRHDEAFAQLRSAANSSPTLFRGLLDLAWAIAPDDSSALEQLVRPNTTDERLQVAKFFASTDQAPAVLAQVKQAGPASTEAQRSLLHDTLSALLASHHFLEAWQVWLLSHPAYAGAAEQSIVNGDFTAPIVQDDPGFGWQIGTVPNIQLVIDQSGPTFGARSLNLSYSGESEPQLRPLRQLVLVKPNSHYTLSFMARAENVVSGGAPVIVVTDPSDPAKKLGRSKPLDSSKNGWETLTVDFSTDEKAAAAVIAVERIQCAQSPCPIFGRLWVSRFVLTASK